MSERDLAVFKTKLEHLEENQNKYKKEHLEFRKEIENKFIIYDNKLSDQTEELAIVKTELKNMSKSIERTERNTEKIVDSIASNKDYFYKYLITTGIGILIWALKDYIIK